MKFIRWRPIIRIPGARGLRRCAWRDLAERTAEFHEPFERELQCPVGALLAAAAQEGRIRADERPLADRGLEALIGWTLNRGA